MTYKEKVQVVIYDAPSVQASSCACGCGGHHQEPGDDPLAATHLEFQTRSLALTLEAAFPGKVEVEYIDVLKDPRGPGCPRPRCFAPWPTPRPWSISTARAALPAPCP